jgi:hypothetical protein
LYLLRDGFAVCARRGAGLEADVVSALDPYAEFEVHVDVRRKSKSSLWRKRREGALFFWES